MKLLALIRKKEIATVTGATHATVNPISPPSVATVASVNVANDETESDEFSFLHIPKNGGVPSRRETLQDKQQETRREKALAILEAAPETLRGIYADTTSDPHNVIVAVAIRHLATCEMTIPKATYNPWRLLELIERLNQTKH